MTPPAQPAREPAPRPRDARSPTERMIERSMIDEHGVGQPLSERALQRQRSIEAYLRGETMPRFMQRAKDIERATRQHEADLADAHRALADACANDPRRFAERWCELARRWDFEAVNQLIAEHNQWYPIERDLPMDPRTGDFVPIHGRSYRRRPLGADWILERFPPALPAPQAGPVRAPA